LGRYDARDNQSVVSETSVSFHPFDSGWKEVQAMATGTVKWFDDAKGYGFIAPDGGGKDLFVHHTQILGEGFKTLAENAKVTYEEREGQKGPEATNVALA
jgi:cold shock protein